MIKTNLARSKLIFSCQFSNACPKFLGCQSCSSPIEISKRSRAKLFRMNITRKMFLQANSNTFASRSAHTVYICSNQSRARSLEFAIGRDSNLWKRILKMKLLQGQLSKTNKTISWNDAIWTAKFVGFLPGRFAVLRVIASSRHSIKIDLADFPSARCRP